MTVQTSEVLSSTNDAEKTVENDISVGSDTISSELLDNQRHVITHQTSNNSENSSNSKTFVELSVTDLIDREEDTVSKVSFAVDDHPGTLSSDWDYKDRRQILEETRTFFNNFIVIERVYESENKEDVVADDCESCATCNSSRASSTDEKSSELKQETVTVVEEPEEVPEIIVHRPSFAIPDMYLVDIEEIKARLNPSRGMCKFILGGSLFIAMVLLFSFAFLGVEHMED